MNYLLALFPNDQFPRIKFPSSDLPFKLDNLNRLLLTPLTIPFEYLHDFVKLLILGSIKIVVRKQFIQLQLTLLAHLLQLLLRFHVRIVDVVNPVRLLSGVIKNLVVPHLSLVHVLVSVSEHELVEQSHLPCEEKVNLAEFKEIDFEFFEAFEIGLLSHVFLTLVVVPELLEELVIATEVLVQKEFIIGVVLHLKVSLA